MQNYNQTVWSSEDCKCCLLALQCEALCVWSIPGRLCGPDWQTVQRWVTAYHKGETSRCVGCMGSLSLCGCSHVHACVRNHIFLSLHSGHNFQDVPPRLFITSRRSGGEEEYQWGQSDIHKSLSGRHSFGARREESGRLSLWTRAFIQRLHRAIFQRALLTSPLCLRHVEETLHQRELISHHL